MGVDKIIPKRALERSRCKGKRNKRKIKRGWKGWEIFVPSTES
jgi:hypothetical protein